MDVNQSSFAYAGTAATVNVQTQTTQKAVQEGRDEVQASTANSAAVSSTDVADVSAASAPESGEGTSAVVASDPPADTTSEHERPRGEKLDISV